MKRVRFLSAGTHHAPRIRFLCITIACLWCAVEAMIAAADAAAAVNRRIMHEPVEALNLDGPITHLPAVDTFDIIWFDFESQDWQGWTRLDNTMQANTFFRVDTLLVPAPERGMWCGRPADTPPCGEPWPGGLGYGNGWRQCLTSDSFTVTGNLTVTFTAYFDSEPGGDVTRLQYESVDGAWIDCRSFDADSGGCERSITLHLGRAETRLRFLFTSDASVSDEDGGWDSKGGCAIAAVHIADSEGPIDDEDFEAGPIHARSADGDANGLYWRAAPGEPYGAQSGLWNLLADKDPCGDNLGRQIIFFIYSEESSPDYPGLFDTPFCTARDAGILCQDEMVISPVVDMTRHSTGDNHIQDAPIPAPSLGGLGGALLNFTVYRDLPFENLVFYSWHIRIIDAATGCPGSWRDRGLIYYGPDRDYRCARHEIGDLVTGDSVQVALGCIDMSRSWYRHRATAIDHTPAPWFDNIHIQRYEATGPRWHYRGMDLFQDNFPADRFDLESFVRADAALDVNPAWNPAIRPGDSIVVSCASPLGGGIRFYCGEPSVFLHVRASYIGDPANPKPPLAGPVLEGNYGRYMSNNGAWTVIQADTARSAAGAATDRYAFDLNDSLFTRGYRIDYYFSACDEEGSNSTLPAEATSGAYFEWTCLPTLAGDILFVDDCDGRGTRDGIVQYYYDTSFQAMLAADNQPDRYDVNAPSAMASNGPGSRAYPEQLITAYDRIIWDCGDLATGTITDGTTDSDKSDDAGLLIDWLEWSDHNVGLWISGDNVASDLTEHMRTGRSKFLLDWCGVRLAADSYFETGIVVPLVKGAPGGLFHDGPYPDTFLVFGGCPVINRFDILETGAAGNTALRYPDFGGEEKIAGVQSVRYNRLGYKTGTVWLGFSYISIRDAEVQAPPVIFQILDRIIDWFDDLNSEPVTGSERPLVNILRQNYPNPFNPVTTIRFGLDRCGPVTLRIYDAAGRHVRTLVDGVLEAGSHTADWDGRSGHDSPVASGVYFYRLASGDFVETRKMVLLR